MIEALVAADKQLFVWLNGLHWPFLDPLMDMVTNRVFWIPFYAMLVLLLALRLRQRAFLLLPLMGAAIGVADSVSSALFKPYFARLRPCHDPELSEVVNLVAGCGGKFGFISSHAANTFAFAVLLHLLLRPRMKAFRIFLFCWAVVVSYSRIYVGVHFPLDILTGALLGTLIGLLFWRLYGLLETRLFAGAASGK